MIAWRFIQNIGRNGTSLRAAHSLANATGTPKSTKVPDDVFRLYHIYLDRAKDYALIMHAATREYLEDPSRPFHIRTLRRQRECEPRKHLYWTIRCPVDISKSATVRSWAKRRIKEAFKAALHRRGWGINGEVLKDEFGAPRAHRRLHGVLVISTSKKTTVKTASGKEVEDACELVLDRVLLADERKRTPGYNPRSSMRKRMSR